MTINKQKMGRSRAYEEKKKAKEEKEKKTKKVVNFLTLIIINCENINIFFLFI